MVSETQTRYHRWESLISSGRQRIPKFLEAFKGSVLLRHHLPPGADREIHDRDRS